PTASGSSCARSGAVRRSFADRLDTRRTLIRKGVVLTSPFCRGADVFWPLPAARRAPPTRRRWFFPNGDGRRAKAMTEEKKPFTVSDRRHFTSDGETRQPTEEQRTPDPPASEQREQPAGKTPAPTPRMPDEAPAPPAHGDEPP